MKKTEQQSVTSLPPSPDEERSGRMRRYAITMSTRLVCFVLAIFTHGWLQLAFVVAAIVLPYFAVVAANTVKRTITPVERPGGLVVSRRVDRPREGE